ncbi:MAG: hypothetical protein PVH61_14155 [Candidatus Aminicenantes bacterium]|jgi:hypothetical protein
MSLQKLSVKFPEPIQFPEGVDGQDLVLHLIAWYFYSLGNSDCALKLTGESPIELEKKLLEYGFSRKWIERMDSGSIRKKVEAMEIVKEADALAQQRINEGWEEEDFKKDFLRVQGEIAEILSKRKDEKGK